MALLSNSLYLDSEYKADCEFKINYLNLLKNDSVDADFSNDVNTDSEGFIADISTDEKRLQNLLTGLIEADDKEKPYFSDGEKLHNTKQISENYYKILIEID